MRDLTGDRDALADQLLDVLEVRALGAVAERNGRALLPCSAGAADAVNVGFRNVRQVVVDDERQLTDVDAARGDVGRNENGDLARLEVLERTLALVLRLVAVDGARLDVGMAEIAGDFIRAVLGAGEHQCLVYIALTDDVGQKFPFFGFFYEIDFLFDLLDRLCRRRDGDMLGLVQQLFGKLGDLRRNGRGEQQGLAFFRQELDDALDIREKAHVEHLVGLVEHEKLDLVQLYDLLTHQIPQTARCRDEDVHAALDGLDLRHL